MLALIDWNAVGALSGLFAVVVTIAGAVAKRARTRKNNLRERQANEIATEQAENSALVQRVAVLEDGQREVMVVLKGRKGTWAEPEIIGLVDMVKEIGADVRTIKNGHS